MDIQITDRANRSDHRPVHTRLRGDYLLLGNAVPNRQQYNRASRSNGLGHILPEERILLVIAFLVSPMGLPMFAVWILSALQGISHFIKSI